MRLILYPYRMYSESAKTLATELGAIRVHPDGRYRRRRDDIIVNWGNGHKPTSWDCAGILNHPDRVAIAVNKLRTFQALGDLAVPYTTERAVAMEWQEDDRTVVARQSLDGNSGQGIVVCGPESDLPTAPLYTRYIRPKGEYRVHVFKGNVIDFVKKRRRQEGVNSEHVRSHNNGWVFCRNNVELRPATQQLCLDAVSTLGLDFGAVDVIETRTKAFVLEINTAPGIEGTTLEKYKAALGSLVNA